MNMSMTPEKRTKENSGHFVRDSRSARLACYFWMSIISYARTVPGQRLKQAGSFRRIELWKIWGREFETLYCSRYEIGRRSNMQPTNNNKTALCMSCITLLIQQRELGWEIYLYLRFQQPLDPSGSQTIAVRG